jgi:type VI protein secretion system component Hcp
MITNKTHLRGGALLPLAAAALVALASHTEAAPRFAVRISDHDGSSLIPGESDGSHKDWIDVLAFGSGVRMGHDENGLPVAGLCAHDGFTFRKRIDKSTPLLQRALTTGLLLPAVQAVYLGPEGSPRQGTEPIAVTLRHVQVLGFRMLGPVGGSAGDPLPTEEVTLGTSRTAKKSRKPLANEPSE